MQLANKSNEDHTSSMENLYNYVKIQNRGAEQENPGRDLRKTDSTEAPIFPLIH